jgi:tetratricopeptide (TPR) repeat protein
MRIRLAVVAFLLGCSLITAAQDPKRQYKSVKDFYASGKYNLAMEMCKPLLTYEKNNPYTEYAAFYYAMSALQLNYHTVAKDMFLQIRKLYPSWDQQSEVSFWLAKIYFDRSEYFQAMHMLTEVRQEDYIEIEQLTNMKRHYLSRIADPEILRMMWEEYPRDADVGTALAWAITRQPVANQDRALFDSVIEQFQLPRKPFEDAAANKPVFRDQYHVSVLFPFLAASLEPSPNKKQNQLVLDLYEGMRMANDSLRKEGIKINLLAYDTERNPNDLEKSKSVVRNLLETTELKNTDLIVGPLFPEEMKMVQPFSEKYQINMINPVSFNSEFVRQNPNAMLFQPSLETMAVRSAELLNEKLRNRKCIVMYGDRSRDSVLAVNFAARAKDLGMTVVWSEKFTKETAHRIITMLATPTEFDEFKNPTQFKMALDSVGSIFVASDDPLIYTKVISSVETRGDSLVIVGSESWLDNTSVDLTKYERLHILLMAPTFTPLKHPAYMNFRRSYIRSHGSFPSQYMNYTKLGYDFMMFTGRALNKYGVYFQDGLRQDGMMPGWLSRGYKWSERRDNAEFPFVYFSNGELMSLN